MKKQNFPFPANAADRLLCRPIFGIPFFFAVLSLVFFLSFRGIGGGLSLVLETAFFRWGESVANTAQRLGASTFTARCLSGLYTAIASSLAFLPQTAIFFLLVRALDDCGYLSRAVFVTDRFFRIFGVSGNAVIPLLLGYGCAVASVPACGSEPSEQCAVIRALPFVPCNARVPVILFLADAFFPRHKTLAAVLIFALSFALIFLSLLISRAGQIKPPALTKGLPELRLPRARVLAAEVSRKSGEYLARAGTAVLLCCAVFSVLSALTPSLSPTEDVSQSILHTVCAKVCVIFRPLGFDRPELTAALIFGFFAKENIISILGVMSPSDLCSLIPLPAAISFTVFCAFYAPCFFLLRAERKRSGAKKALSLLLRTLAIAYALSQILYTLSFIIFGNC